MRFSASASVVALGMFLVAGCGEQEAAKAGGGWQEQDVCQLLTPEQTGGFLGDDASQPKRTEKFERPGCRWTGKAGSKIELQLWQPPAPDVITDDPRRELDVDGKPGYVTSETTSSCLMDVDGQEAFVQLNVSSTLARIEEPRFCDEVAPLAESVLAQMGW